MQYHYLYTYSTVFTVQYFQSSLIPRTLRYTCLFPRFYLARYLLNNVTAWMTWKQISLAPSSQSFITVQHGNQAQSHFNGVYLASRWRFTLSRTTYLAMLLAIKHTRSIHNVGNDDNHLSVTSCSRNPARNSTFLSQGKVKHISRYIHSLQSRIYADSFYHHCIRLDVFN